MPSCWKTSGGSVLLIIIWQAQGLGSGGGCRFKSSLQVSECGWHIFSPIEWGQVHSPAQRSCEFNTGNNWTCLGKNTSPTAFVCMVVGGGQIHFAHSLKCIPSRSPQVHSQNLYLASNASWPWSYTWQESVLLASSEEEARKRSVRLEEEKGGLFPPESTRSSFFTAEAYIWTIVRDSALISAPHNAGLQRGEHREPGH